MSDQQTVRGALEETVRVTRRGVEEALNPVNVRLFEQLASFRWPTVAVIDGPAFGGGLELALARDLRVGTPVARFATPELSKLALRLGQRDTKSFDLVAQGLLYESEDAAARMNAFLERRRAR